MKRQIKKIIMATTIIATTLTTGFSVYASRPRNIKIIFDNGENVIEGVTSKGDLREAIEEIGYTIKDKDIITSDSEQTYNNMSINIQTEKTGEIIKDNLIIPVSTNKMNVKDVLKEFEIQYDEDDLISPSLDTKVLNGFNISVKDFKLNKYSKYETIPYKNIIKFDFNKELGTEEVTQKGKNGKKENLWERIEVSGKEIENKKVGEKIVNDPIDEIIIKGSKLIKEETIKYKTEEISTKKLYKGESKVAQEGSNGKKVLIYKVEDKKEELVSEEIVKKPTNKIIEYGTKEKPVVRKVTSKKRNPKIASTRSSLPTSAKYSLRDLKFHGVINWSGYKFTYYSQRVLPGGGLRIPGRHVNSAGYVADKDGYIVLANSAPKGTVINTPFGYKGKVYDRGTYGNHFDVYTR